MAFQPVPKRLKRTRSFYEAAAAAAVPAPVLQNAEQDMQIAKLNRKVNQLSGTVERKQINTALANTGVGTGGLLTSLDTVAQGDTSLTRNGLSIRPLFVEWKVLLESEIVDVYNGMRMMIVQSHIGPLTSANFSGIWVPSTEVQLNQYTVLYDSTTILQNGFSGNPTDGSNYYTKYYWKTGKTKIPRKIYYLDGVSTASRNNVYVWFISDSAVVNHPDVEIFEAKLVFHDD